MQKNIITNKITPCCGLPFSFIYWWVSNLTLNSESDRQFILSKISQNGILSIDGWKVLINSGTLESDSPLTKTDYLAWFDCSRQPNCEQLKILIESYKIGNYNPLDEYGVGWTVSEVYEEYNGKIIKKISGYFGGIGDLPQELQDNIGKYFGTNGNLVTDKDLAVDFKDYANGVNLPYFEDLNAPILEKTQFIYNNAIYFVKSGFQLGNGETPATNPEKVEKMGGSDELMNLILKYFIENKTFTTQDETNTAVGTMETWNQQPNGVNGFTTFIIDNTNKDVVSFHVKGQTSYGESYISAHRFDNSYVVISAPHDGINVDGESTWNLSPYKTIYISLVTTSGQFVKTKRSTTNPPVEDAVKKYIDNSVKKNDDLLGVFTNGYDLINLPIAKNGGGMRISGAWEANDYSNYMEIPIVSGYNKLYFKGKGTGYYPELFPAILAIVGTTPTIIKQGSDNEVIEGVFDIPANTKKLYINFPTPIEDVDGVPKAVVLIKPSDVKDAVFKYVNKAVGAKPTLTNELLAFPKPKTLIRIDLEGTMPTDTTDARTPTSQVLRMSDEFGKEFLKCNITNAIQGNITAGNVKNNYNIKLLNDAGKKLKVKFGTWFPDSSIHLKGYGQDFSLSRTVSGGKLLKQIFDSRPFPKSYIAQFPSNVPSNEPHKNNFLNDANFYIDGFPVEVYHNGVFIGLWIAQQRREPENFHFNDEDENQIFITNENRFEVLQPFNGFYAPHWEVKSPKINGYSAGGAVTNANVLAKLNRFFDWMKGVYNGTIDFLATANDYIDIDNWIDVLIHSELIGNGDYYNNNLNFGMWADEKVKMFSTDLDLTVGISGQTNVFYTAFIGFSSLQPQIKLRYTELRNKGIIDLNNIFKTYNEIPAIIGSKKMRDNYDYWLPKGGVQQQGKNSIQYIMGWYKDRITWLDSQWLLP